MNVMKDKIGNALAAKKEVIAQNMMNNSEEEDEVDIDFDLNDESEFDSEEE